jgi:hypothetical protein
MFWYAVPGKNLAILKSTGHSDYDFFFCQFPTFWRSTSEPTSSTSAWTRPPRLPCPTCLSSTRRLFSASWLSSTNGARCRSCDLELQRWHCTYVCCWGKSCYIFPTIFRTEILCLQFPTYIGLSLLLRTAALFRSVFVVHKRKILTSSNQL